MATEKDSQSKQSRHKSNARSSGLKINPVLLLPTSGSPHESPTSSPLPFQPYGPLLPKRRWIYVTLILFIITYLFSSPHLIVQSWRSSSTDSPAHSRVQWEATRFTPGKPLQVWQEEAIVKGNFQLVPGIRNMWTPIPLPNKPNVAAEESIKDPNVEPSPLSSFLKPEAPDRNPGASIFQVRINLRDQHPSMIQAVSDFISSFN